MKKEVALIGLAGSLMLRNVSFAKNGEDIDAYIRKELNNPLPINAEIGTNKVKISTETIKSDIAIVDIEIPVIKGLKDGVYQEQLNYIIKRTAEKDFNQFKKEVEGLKKLDIEWKPEIKINYEIKSEEDILSFVITTYSYTGGANGMSRRDYYNIDVKENETIRLKDLFIENSDFKAIISDEIKRQIKEQMDTDEKAYFEGEDGFKSIKDDQEFYIDEDGNLVVVFQLYEIAPRSSGYPEFQISGERIVHILKDVKPVIINGKKIKLQNPMYKSKKGIIMMPLAEVAKALDFEVAWDGKNKVVNINKGTVLAGAYIGKDQYYFSKALIHLEEEAKLIKGRTYVPISFIEQVLQGQIIIDEDNIINIKY